MIGKLVKKKKTNKLGIYYVILSKKQFLKLSKQLTDALIIKKNLLSIAGRVVAVYVISALSGVAPIRGTPSNRWKRYMSNMLLRYVMKSLNCGEGLWS